MRMPHRPPADRGIPEPHAEPATTNPELLIHPSTEDLDVSPVLGAERCRVVAVLHRHDEEMVLGILPLTVLRRERIPPNEPIGHLRECLPLPLRIAEDALPCSLRLFE